MDKCPLPKAEGDDPCQGCKVRKNLVEPQYHTTVYAVLLADYIEAFRPPPDKLPWRDFNLYRLFLVAKAEEERSRWENKDGRKSKKIPD